MLYFRKNDEVIEKYQVSFDINKIEELKREIIDNCSYIYHREYESDYTPIFTNEIIKNFRYIPTGKEKEYYEETRDIYLYSYDEYKPPYLVELINQLLKGNSNIIDKILNYDIHTKTSIDDRINLANQEFIKIDSDNITKRKEKLKELEELLKIKELNTGKKSIELYYNKLIELIIFTLIDSLPISDLNRVKSFFEINLSNKVEISNLKEKILKK